MFNEYLLIFIYPTSSVCVEGSHYFVPESLFKNTINDKLVESNRMYHNRPPTQ